MNKSLSTILELFSINLLSLTLLVCVPADSFAQLERQRVQADGPVELTFMAPKNINLYTSDPLGKGELHYSIMHTFGEVNLGPRNLWGIDGGANVRFSFEYGFNNQFSAGIGRSSLDKIVDFYAKFSLLRQTKSGFVPVSVSFIPTGGINTTDPDFLPDNYAFTDRLNAGFSLPIARKFNDKLSLQVSPMLIHFNRVGPEIDVMDSKVNNYYTAGFAGRYKIKPQTALSFQYIPPLTDASNLDPNIAVGIDIETGGHVFQMFFTTSRALNDQYLIAGRNGDFFTREFRFGFNINRLFRLN